MKKIVLIALVVFALVGVAMSQGGGAAAPGAQRGGAAQGARGGGMAAAPPATGPIADLANAGITAMNGGDEKWFDSHLAADVVWFDEDGHAIAGKDRVMPFIKRSLLTGTKKVSVTGLRVGENWAGYVYTIDAGGAQKKGTQTIVYKKVGNDWQIAMVHGAVAAAGHM